MLALRYLPVNHVYAFFAGNTVSTSRLFRVSDDSPMFYPTKREARDEAVLAGFTVRADRRGNVRLESVLDVKAIS